MIDMNVSLMIDVCVVTLVNGREGKGRYFGEGRGRYFWKGVFRELEAQGVTLDSRVKWGLLIKAN